MCGILFAVNSGKYSVNIDDYIRDAFIASQVRGSDSSGIFQVDEGKVSWEKDNCNATSFVKQPNVSRLIGKSAWSDITVGHVRSATVGTVSRTNAHPFYAMRDDDSYIIMVHNGTLTNWRNKKGSDDFDVDSAWMAHMLATEGTDAFEYFQGAFALVWYDSRHPDSLFMARNSERPLHYCVVNDGTSIVGASELGMLGWLTAKHDLEIDEKSVHNNVYYLEPGKLYEFSTKDIGSYKMTNYPAHNSATTEVRATVINALYPSPKWPMDMGMYDDEEYYSEYYVDKPGNYYAARKTPTYYDQEAILDGVKEALKKARNGDTETVTYNPLSMADIIDAPPVDAGDYDEFDKGTITLSSANTASATSGEIKRARATKSLGMVVRFTGLLHTPSEQSVIGCFLLVEDGVEREYDAEMRYITTAEAKKYMDPNLDKASISNIAVVVGLSDDDLVVVAPLTQEQLTFIRDYTEAVDFPETARAS